MKTIYQIFLILFLGSQLHAQQEIQVPLMSHLASSSKANPARMPKYKWNMQMPSLGFGFLHTGPSFKDLYTRDASGMYQLNGQQAIDEFDKSNIFTGSFSGDIFGLDYTWDNNSVNVRYGSYVDAAIKYTADGARLLLKGNGNAVGETLTVGPAFNFNVYDKLGIGYVREIEKLTLGGRVNFLFGRKALSTEEQTAKLTTGSDYYKLNLETSYVVHSSDFVDVDTNTNKVNFADMTFKPGFGGNGSGVGFDFGVGYQFDDAISGYLSITDLGSITWKNNTSTYSSHKRASYGGVKIESLAKLDTASLSGMLDSIQKFVDFDKSVGEFKTRLTPNIMMGGTWKFTDNITFDGVLGAKKVLGRFLPMAGVGVQFELNEWAKVGTSFSYQNKRVNHVGLNTTLEFLPFQMFMGTDNILTFLMPKSANTMHFRFGVNVMFGKYTKRKTIYGLG